MNLQENDINVCRIESRQSKSGDNECEIFVDIECEDSKMDQLCKGLKQRLLYQQNLHESTDSTDGACQHLDPPGIVSSLLLRISC